MDNTHVCQQCPVFSYSLFADIDADLIAWLATKKVNRELNKGDLLFEQNRPVEGIFCHYEGLAKVVQTDNAGKERFTRLVLPGDSSGHRSVFIEPLYKGTAKAISMQLRACFIAKQDILHLFANSASFAKNLVTKIAIELQRLEEEAISTKEKPVRNRLAHLIFRLCNDHSEKLDDNRYRIKSEISKRDIASLLMVASETVIRLMSEMKSEGLIEYDNKHLLVTDYDKVRKLARI